MGLESRGRQGGYPCASWEGQALKKKHAQKHRRRKNAANALLMACGIRFFLAAALTGNRILGGYAPFALGCVAASGPGLGAFAAFGGAAVGALFLMDFAEALPFLAACALILAASIAFRGNRVLTSSRVVSLTAAALFLSVGMIYVFEAERPADAFLSCLAAAGLTGASAWFFRPLLHPGKEGSPAQGIVFLTAALLLSAQNLNFGGISPGRMLLCVLLACSSFAHGPAVGAMIGLALGLTADFCAGSGNCVLTAAFGLGSLLCGRYSAGQRWRGALYFLGGVCAVLLSADDPLSSPLLVECGGGMLLFLLLPDKLFKPRRALPKPSGHESAKRLKERLNRAAAALRDLYDNCAVGGATAEENPAVIFDRAAERSCRNCARCEICWQDEYSSTFQALNAAAPPLLNRGHAVPGDFPQFFLDRCVRPREFLTAVNLELSAYLLRGQYRKQLEETRRAARRQYAQLSELLAATVSAEEQYAPAFGQEPPPCRFGTALRPKSGESVCGDTALSFRTENGLWCLLLADGMGSGAEAKEESSLTCRLLRQFLEAGIRPESALRTLNSAMALRGAVTGSFTTMDLCTFDAFSGDAAFYKYGAAPSYLKKGGAVRRITGLSLPVGLRDGETEPDVTRVRLDPGSFAVMISDGVADPSQDQWLQSLLADWTSNEPQDLARAIMTESLRRQNSQDDRGIQILYWPSESVLSA
ncbi:MAG: SpoIIE family protein phosphatase [Oscillibacter sp.]|nr:SpoIIE family protein phosphatase [Oscillibacter sp.]